MNDRIIGEITSRPFFTTLQLIDGCIERLIEIREYEIKRHTHQREFLHRAADNLVLAVQQLDECPGNPSSGREEITEKSSLKSRTGN